MLNIIEWKKSIENKFTDCTIEYKAVDKCGILHLHKVILFRSRWFKDFLTKSDGKKNYYLEFPYKEDILLSIIAHIYGYVKYRSFNKFDNFHINFINGLFFFGFTENDSAVKNKLDDILKFINDNDISYSLTILDSIINNNFLSNEFKEIARNKYSNINNKQITKEIDSIDVPKNNIIIDDNMIYFPIKSLEFQYNGILFTLKVKSKLTNKSIYPYIYCDLYIKNNRNIYRTIDFYYYFNESLFGSEDKPQKYHPLYQYNDIVDRKKDCNFQLNRNISQLSDKNKVFKSINLFKFNADRLVIKLSTDPVKYDESIYKYEMIMV